MSWRAMPMRFPGTCIVCKKKIDINEVALWAKGLGVKHRECAEVMELKCTICGGPAGCQQCEFSPDCDRSKVSQLCICKTCYEKKGSFSLYMESTARLLSPLGLDRNMRKK